MTDVGEDIETKELSPAVVAPLEAVLERLATEGGGAPAYERLHMRLVTFFRLRFPAEAEALADEAIDRLGRRLGNGTSIESLAGYALGIARFLVLETAGRQKKERDAAHAAMLEIEPQIQDKEPDLAGPALRACLESIGPESAQFILDYYGADSGAARIERRRKLAEGSGMTLNNFRNRALRIRIALEKCVQARLRTESPHLIFSGDRTAGSGTTDKTL